MPVASILARYEINDNLKQAILNVSNQLNELAGTKDNKSFVIHCIKSIAKLLGKHFKVLDYSYDVIYDDKIGEGIRQEEGYSTNDIWITIKE